MCRLWNFGLRLIEVDKSRKNFKIGFVIEAYFFVLLSKN